MISRIQLRRDTAANWEANNPVLAIGEIGIDTSTFNFKIGNGVDGWNSLNYFSVEVEDVISQQQLNDAIAAIGGDGIVFDSGNGVYNLDLSSVSQDIVPETTETHDLGSPTKRWNDLYLSGDTIFLGDIQLKDSGDGKFEVLAGDGETTLETVLLPGQVTDNELSDDAADLKTRFATHRDATNNPHSVTATQVGLGNVTNESKATMFTDAALTGVPTAPTAAASTNTTQIANTAFVQSEINAAGLALGTNYSVADIEERDDLENLVVGDIIFVADNGDEKWAQYKVTVASPNAEFLKIMDQDILINALDAPGIKTAYESNADTNAFTDAEQTRLAGLELGVTVQPFDADTVIDANYETFDSSATYLNLRAQATTAGDVGLGNVTNESKATMFTDPTFTGTVSGVTATHVGLGNLTNNLQATKTEFDSHTSDSTIHFTQAQISITESQISDLQTYELADATILKSADIGVTVQEYDANTVIDANYETFDSSETYPNLRAQATTAGDVGLGNVTNESKGTMFTDPTFTGTVSGVTKAMVGLSNVENFEIATKEEAEIGTETNKYMNPLRTSEAIEFQTNVLLTSGGYATETFVENSIAAIGGDGLLFDSNNIVYNLDYATQQEVEAGTSTTKVLTPASIEFMVIDGGEFN